MRKIAIIDFATSEVVRGSFGYDSYLLYSALKLNPKMEVDMYEDATPFKLHRMDKKYDEYIIHFWSYPQIESVLWSQYNFKGTISFIGYKPLIDKHKLKHCTYWTKENLLKGMQNLPNIYKDMKYGLMSDCSLHIKDDDKRPVMPLFTSYGCPNNCKFCPIPANRGHLGKDKRVFLDNNALYDALNKAFIGNNNVHLCDEDIFVNVDWANKVIEYLIVIQDAYKIAGNKPFKWIALGSINTFYNYIKKYGKEKLIQSGCHLIELGIEAKDELLRKSMNKTGTFEQVDFIINNTKEINKFWLTVTFFPGETITTLNIMGDWLRIHGTQPNMLEERLITNGFVGGLGQMYQPYDGTIDFDTLPSKGMILTNRPVRLIPSYIPYSFLECRPIKTDKKFDFNDVKWFNTYNIRYKDYNHLIFNGRNKVATFWKTYGDIKIMIYIALMARLGYIKEAKE